ncbi:MAG: hypothetical protein HC866_12925 [Leptolyngbyaceae cyanobacterium RU_5_1]|nr:hypothetical protein [Leptolyngbyaceae cyanobacterium RU_5_1]
MATYDNQESRDRAGQSNRDNLPGQIPDQPVRTTGIVNSQPMVSQTNYREGYTQGRLSEQRVYEEQQVRDNDNAARGLLVGVLLAGLVGVTIGTVWLLNDRDRVPDANPVNVVPSVSPSPNQSPQVRERVIERDRVVPVPQQQAPAPDVNVTIPAPIQQAPAPERVPPQTETQGNPQDTAPTQPDATGGQ